MKNEMQDFLTYLKVERRYSPETIHAYDRDIQHFYDYLTEVPIHSWNDVTVVDVRIYLGVLHRENYNRSSISRFLSSLRSFYHFLVERGVVETTSGIRRRAERVSWKDYSRTDESYEL